MSTRPAAVAFLPENLAEQARHELRKLDPDYQWKISRLMERAYAEGYDAAYMRGFHDGWGQGKAAAEVHGDDQ